MKKKFSLIALLSLFLLCAAGFLGIGSVLAANGDDNNVSFYTNYNEPMLLTIIAEKNGENVGNAEGSFERFFETGTEIYIYVHDSTLTGNEYVKFGTGESGVYLNGAALDKVSGEEYYLVEVVSEMQVCEIEVIFDLKVFSLDAKYFDAYNNEITDDLDNPGIEFFKLDRYGNKIKISEIGYFETLIVEPSETVTANSGNMSYSLRGVYFYIIDENGDMKVTNDYPDYRITVDNTFIENFAFYDDTVQFAASYVKDNVLTVSFNDDDYAVDVLEIKDGREVPFNGINLYKDGEEVRIIMQLKPYTALTKNTDGRYIIEDLTYSSDIISVTDNEVTITCIMTRDKNLVVYLELIEFQVDQTGSEFDGAELIFNKTSFVYGDKLVVHSAVEGNNEIKSWTLNGNAVPKKAGEISNGIKRIDEENIEIDTAIWFDLYQNSFKSEIKTGIKTSMLLSIIIPSGAAILVILILAVLIISHTATKKKIRHYLEEKKKLNYTYNQGDMIADLRAGKSLEVTEEDVKAEMKKKK